MSRNCLLSQLVHGCVGTGVSVSIGTHPSGIRTAELSHVSVAGKTTTRKVYWMNHETSKMAVWATSRFAAETLDGGLDASAPQELAGFKAHQFGSEYCSDDVARTLKLLPDEPNG